MRKDEEQGKELETDAGSTAEEQEEPTKTTEETEPEETAEEEQAEETTEEEVKPEEAPVSPEEKEAVPLEEEEKPPKEERAKEVEEEIVEERVYTVPLGKALIMPANRRAPRAMRILRAFIVKHMKLEAQKETEGEEAEEPSRLIVSNEVNLKIWSRGIGKPPRKIRVRAAKNKEGDVTVYLAEGD